MTTGFERPRQAAEAALVSAARAAADATLRLLERDPAAILPRVGTTLRSKLVGLAQAEVEMRAVEEAERRAGV